MSDTEGTAVADCADDSATPTMKRDSLEPKLAEAQQILDAALEEACGVDVRKANTGEMIRIEETLSAAASAAKEVVSVRLRRREQQRSGKTASLD